MTTGTPGTQARQFDWQATHYLRKAINWNDANIGTADKVKVGILPKLASIVGVWMEIVTPFNAGGTNVVTVGSNPGNDNAGDTTLFALYTQSGAAASQGQAIIIVEYVPNNDQ